MKFTGSSVEEAIQNGLQELDIPRKKAHITVIAREKKGFFGFGKKPAVVDIDVINETTVVKANQKAVRGVPSEINELNEPVKSVSEATIDLGKVVAAVKEFEKSGEVLDDRIKAQILKNEKDAKTILEETGRIEIIQEDAIVAQTSPEIAPAVEVTEPVTPVEEERTTVQQEFADLDIPVQESYQIEEVVEQVTAYIQSILDDMDVETTIDSSHNRRSINLQIDTNEPGRVIGYHGKVLKSLQLLAQNYLFNRYERNFYISINVNDYVEHRAEVLQGYAQKLAERVLLEGEAYHTDPMSSSERKIIHRIISKMEGLTSYSEGSEPNRYVVVDVDSQRD
ncbi:RNA-binding cell elongation regulator Jag/EloR [Streptococcus suis]|uniref:RNA-binding cell elongation regulator Jag/EloR n=1 Tax=Streptococcus suis TaxID=1307 RepID=UPI001ABE1457|nr:Jag N-terminal domain-containing protein [Streptococcus suis]